MKNLRCDAVAVQIIVTQYDDLGRPINEYNLPPVKVFRATAREFWNVIDTAVTEAVKNSKSAVDAKNAVETPIEPKKKGSKKPAVTEKE